MTRTSNTLPCLFMCAYFLLGALSFVSHSVRQVLGVVSALGIGGFFLLLGSAWLIQTIRFRWVALPARGVVVGYEVEVRESGEDKGTYHHPQISFLDSTSQQRTGVLRVQSPFAHERFPLSKESEILYDPAHPGEVRDAGTAQFWFPLCVALFTIAGSGTVVLAGIQVLLGRKEVTL